MRLRRVCVFLLSALLWINIFPLYGNDKYFNDKPASSVLPEGTREDTFDWTEEYVNKIKHMNVLSSHDSYQTMDGVTRSDFVRWLINARKLELLESNHHFEDLTDKHPNYSYVMTALEIGIIEKTSHFYPDDFLLRSDASLWLVNTHSEFAQQLAKAYTEPLIPAQDGYDQVPAKAIGSLSVCYLPDYQLMEYRYLLFDDYRYVQAEAPILFGEAAHSLYMLLKPPIRGGELIIGMPMEPLSLFYNRYLSTFDVESMLYEGDIRGRDQTWGVFPSLIKRIPTQKNGLRKIKYDENGVFVSMEDTIELRSNIKWSDGSPILAHDFVFGHYFLNHPSFSGFSSNSKAMKSILRVEALDQQTVKIFWHKPYFEYYAVFPLPRNYFEENHEYRLDPYDINDPNYYIEPKNIEDEGFKSEKYLDDANFIFRCIYRDTFERNPLHAGPYRVSSWQKDDEPIFEAKDNEIILEANEHYLFGKPLIPKIKIKNINLLLKQNLYEEIINGKIHVALPEQSGWGLNYEDAIKLLEQNHHSHNLHFFPRFTWSHIDFNVDDPVLSDVRVRKALMYASNKKEILHNTIHSSVFVADSFFPKHHPAYVKSQIPTYEYNLEMATKLLDEAGWTLNNDTKKREKNGKPLTITFMTTKGNDVREKLQSAISSQWRNLGIEVKIKNQDMEVFLYDTLDKRKFTGPTALLYAFRLEPNSNLYSILHSSNIPTSSNRYRGSNYTGYKNNIVDKLLEENMIVLDKKKFYQNLMEIQKIVLEDLPSIPLYFEMSITSAHKQIANFMPSSRSSGIALCNTNSANTWNSAFWYWKSEEDQPFFPQMSIKPQELNYFNVSRGFLSSQKLNIENSGKDLLKGSIVAFDKCIDVKVSSFSIEPQKSIEVEVILNPDLIEKAGNWESKLKITSNDPNQKEVIIPTKAYLAPPKLVMDTEVLDFGRISLGKTPEMQLQFTNDGGENLEVNLGTIHTAITLSEIDFIVKPRDSKSIIVRLDSNQIKEYGDFSSQLSIESNDPDNSRFRIDVQAYILQAPRIKLEKEVIVFGKIDDVADYQARACMISNQGEDTLIGKITLDAPFKAEVVQVSDDFNVAEPLNEFELAGKESLILGILLRPVDIKSIGAFKGKIIIRTNDPELSEVIIPFKGTYGYLIELTIGHKIALVNDEKVDLNVAPLIQKGRTLVPLRFIGEAFGAEVKWLPDQNNEIQLILKLQRIRLWLGKNKALIEPLYPDETPIKEISLEVSPQVLQGRTIVPLRFISESFGASIEWEAESQKIRISYKE